MKLRKHIYGILLVSILCMVWLPCISFAYMSDEECEQVHQMREANAIRLLRDTLARDDVPHLHFALSALWLNERVEEANERLRQAYEDFLEGEEAMTPRIADEKVKWQMRTWLRIYYLFSRDSQVFPGRLAEDVEARMKELFWNYGYKKSSVLRAAPAHVWILQGSENHDMMDLSNAFLALQAIHTDPPYKNKPLQDGNLPRRHVRAWEKYYTLYCKERAGKGLFAEVYSPTYGKYFIPELINLYDFCHDADLKRSLEKLLHVIWADFAACQLRGVRGGGRTRVYQGNYEKNAGQDSWYLMSLPLFDMGEWNQASMYSHPIHGFNYILATTTYRPLDVVIDLALSTKQRGEYIYQSVKAGKMADAPDEGLQQKLAPYFNEKHPLYQMDGEHPMFVLYSYCTPSVILGSILIDPSILNYAGISTQNRWQGMIFSKDFNARIFPQCVGHHKGVTTYRQHIAVQHRNVMLMQKHPKAHKAGAMRVFFLNGLKSSTKITKGWFLGRVGDAYYAVKGLTREDRPDYYFWEDNEWLHLKDEWTPLVFVTATHFHFKTLAGFQDYVLKHKFDINDRTVEYRFDDLEGNSTQLKLYRKKLQLPEINNRPIDLIPKKTYDSPYIYSGNNNQIHIQFGNREQTIDFNTNGSALKDWD